MLCAAGLADASSYLLAPDQGALQLLHALPWEPVLAHVAPAARLGTVGAAAPGLDATTRQWAMQLALLALQALVLLPDQALPGWLRALLEPPAGAAAHGLIRPPEGVAEL